MGQLEKWNSRHVIKSSSSSDMSLSQNPPTPTPTHQGNCWGLPVSETKWHICGRMATAWWQNCEMSHQAHMMVMLKIWRCEKNIMRVPYFDPSFLFGGVLSPTAGWAKVSLYLNHLIHMGRLLLNLNLKLKLLLLQKGFSIELSWNIQVSFIKFA